MTTTNTLEGANLFQLLVKVPEFNGKIGELSTFTTQVEQNRKIINEKFRTLFDIRVRHKIVGEASRVLIVNGNPYRWDIVSEILSRNFGSNENYFESEDLNECNLDNDNTIGNIVDVIMDESCIDERVLVDSKNQNENEDKVNFDSNETVKNYVEISVEESRIDERILVEGKNHSENFNECNLDNNDTKEDNGDLNIKEEYINEGVSVEINVEESSDTLPDEDFLDGDLDLITGNSQFSKEDGVNLDRIFIYQNFKYSFASDTGDVAYIDPFVEQMESVYTACEGNIIRANLEALEFGVNNVQKRILEVNYLNLILEKKFRVIEYFKFENIIGNIFKGIMINLAGSKLLFLKFKIDLYNKANCIVESIVNCWRIIRKIYCKRKRKRIKLYKNYYISC